MFVLEDKVVACDSLTQFHPMHFGFILASPSISLHLGSILSLMSFSLSKFYGIPPERLSLEAPVVPSIDDFGRNRKLGGGCRPSRAS